MKLSDTTTKSGLLQKCEQLTGLGNTAITGDTTTLKPMFTGLLNTAYHKVWAMILSSQDEWDLGDVNQTTYGRVTVPLTTNRDYPIPASYKVLKIKNINVCYDGTSNTCYPATPIDTSDMEFGLGNDTNTDANFSAQAPRYDLFSNSIQLYPKATSSNVSNSGIMQIEWIVEPTELSSDTDEPSIDEPFQILIPILASLEYCVGNLISERIPVLQQMAATEEARLKQYYGQKQLDRRYTLIPKYIDYN